MAGRITELAALTGAVAATSDLIETVDVSDLSMAATGTNKKFSLAELILFLQNHGVTSGLIVDDVAPADTTVLWADTTEQGSSGASVLSGTVPPTSGDGNDGDFWIDTNTWMIYGPRADATWPAGVPMTGGEGGGLTEAEADARYLMKAGDSVPTADFEVRSIGSYADTAESYLMHIGCDTIFANELVQVYGSAGVYLEGTAITPTNAKQVTSKQYVDAQRDTRQPLDTDLTTIAGLTATTDNVIQSVAGAWASRTPAQLKTSLALTATDVGLGNVTNVAQQPLDSDLTTIAGLTATTDNVIQSVAGAWASRTPAQLKTSLALTASDVGLGSVTNNAQYYAGGTDVAVADGGTGRSTSTTAYGLIAAGTTATGAHQTISPGTSGHFLKSGGGSALAAFAAIANTDVSGLGSLATKSTIATADITDDNVTNAKLANMATNTLKGNNTGSSADPADLTVAQVQTMLGIASPGVKMTVSSTAPSTPATNDLWVDTT